MLLTKQSGLALSKALKFYYPLVTGRAVNIRVGSAFQHVKTVASIPVSQLLTAQPRVPKRRHDASDADSVLVGQRAEPIQRSGTQSFAVTLITDSVQVHPQPMRRDFEDHAVSPEALIALIGDLTRLTAEVQHEAAHAHLRHDRVQDDQHHGQQQEDNPHVRDDSSGRLPFWCAAQRFFCCVPLFF